MEETTPSEESMVVGEKRRLWIMSQLTLHGVTFDPNEDEACLKGKLVSAIREDKKSKRACNGRKTAAELRDDCISMIRGCLDRLDWRITKFGDLDTPTQEVLFDVDMFMEKYFLDEAMRPDRSKTKEAIILEIAPMRELLDRLANIGDIKEYTLAQGIQTAFKSIDRPDFPLDIPTAEANMDIALFLQKYFIDDEGRPMKTRILNPIQFAPFLDPSQKEKLAATIKHTPDLVMERVASERGVYMLIGWEKDVKAHKEEHTLEELRWELDSVPFMRGHPDALFDLRHLFASEA
ncbi:hypothetical protein F4810DRAFT_708747 [Camillea tinctor]|nr:hypothetical protein F4810DRAFT_708747 [Camillea tinctor]